MAEYSVYYSKVDNPLSLKKLLRTLRRRWVAVVVVSATAFTGVAAYTLTRTPLYESAASIIVDSNTIPVSEISDGKARLSQEMLSTEIAILKSDAVIGAAISKLRDANGNPLPEGSMEKVVKNLSIKQERGAMVLRLTYRNPDPQMAKDLLTALARTYGEYNLADRRSKTSNAIGFIQAKLPQVKKQLDKSALVVTQFRKKYSIVDPDTYAASVYTMRQGLEAQAQELQIKMAQTQKQFEELQRQVGKSADAALSSAILGQDTTYQALVKQFQEVETSYFLERTRFQDAHPTVQALKARRDQLYNLLQVQAETVLGVRAPLVRAGTEGGSEIKQNMANKLFETQTMMVMQEAQMGSIRLAQRQISAMFAQIPQLQQSFTEIQRQFNLDSSTYSKLSEKLEELRIAQAQEISSWRLLDSPFLPEMPVSPDLRLNFILGGFVSFLMGVGIAVFLERLDERIREVDEVRELTDIPLIGSVPRTDGILAPAKAGLIPSTSHSAFKEALRSLALNLRYLGADRSVKTIAFTSAVPSEGKSTLVYNLGVVLAELGHKVLVVDADMRKPTMHKQAKVRNSFGLSTAIATNRHWRQTVQAPDVMGPMHVITSGPLPPNPVALLESTKMARLLELWRDTYDYVLIDTPPIIGIADAQSLAPKVDSVVLVAAMERSTRSAIARAAEILGANDCNIAGILLNLIDKSDSNYYYDYYSAYYVANPALADAETEEAVETLV